MRALEAKRLLMNCCAGNDNKMAPNTLSIEHLSKSYNKHPVIKDISIYLKRGEIVGLFGPNGAGKTTCFNIIAGLIKADSGQLMLEGQDVMRLPMHLRAKLGISYLPQESSIFRGLNVEDNIRAIAEIWTSGRDEQTHIVENLLAEFNISHLRSLPAINLSGGERRRLEIARMLAGNPKFIILDEPLAGIDPIAVNGIKYLISNLKERNIGVLITDHNVRDSLNIVDRAYIIYDGGVLIEGTPEEIINSKRAQKVYLGDEFRI
jgi:lipopolysaccharide export system ATP-binding protein